MAHQRRMNVDVSEKEIGKLKLGDEVTLTATGKVVELTAADAFGSFMVDDEEEEQSPSVNVKISKVSVVKAKGNNAFGEMANEDEKEGD